MTRKMTSDSRLQAMPHRKEAKVKAITAKQKVRTTPKRCISQPVSGTVTPLATAKAVMTQVPLLVETPRLPEMVGSDTLAMVVSSTCMKVPSARAKAAIPSETPVSGPGPAFCAEASLTARTRPDWRR